MLLCDDNLVVYKSIYTIITDLSKNDYYNSLPEERKRQWYNQSNYTSYEYALKYITKKESYGEINKESFNYETYSEDGLGEYSYIVNGEYVDKRISKAEADAIFASHGQIVVLNEGSFVIR